jgi:membrane protein
LKTTFYQRVEEFVLKHSLILGFIKWAKRTSFPGFHKTPVWYIVDFILREIWRDDLFIRAQAISFSFFLSLFPSIIALFTMLPILNISIFQFLPQSAELEYILYEEIKSIMPGEAGTELFNFIKDTITSPRFALFSFGFILAIYFGASGMMTLMRSFEKSYEAVFRQRAYWRKQLVAIALIFVLFFLLLMSVVFIITGSYIVDWLVATFRLDWFSFVGLALVRWVVIVFIFYTGIGFIYRYGAATHQRFPFLSPGTSVATILCILISVIFSFYVDNFGDYNQFYGSLGALIVIMLWIQFNVMALLIGFELNVSIAIHKHRNTPIHLEAQD